jgi:hypothetical protein
MAVPVMLRDETEESGSTRWSGRAFLVELADLQIGRYTAKIRLSEQPIIIARDHRSLISSKRLDSF